MVKAKRAAVKPAKSDKMTEALMAGKNTPASSTVPFYDIYRDGVTQGALARFLACPESFRLGMTEGFTSVRTGGALAFGSVFHDVLDKVYSTIKPGDKPSVKSVLEMVGNILPEMEARDRAKLREKKILIGDEEEILDENYGLVEVLLRHYFQRWIASDRARHWLSLETKFSIPFDPKKELGLNRPVINVRGKRDGDFRTQRKELWLFETKTKARIEEDDIISKLGFDLQVCMYLWGMQIEYGERPYGVLYNVVRRPQLRRGKTETLKDFIARVDADIPTRPDFYFVRYECSISAGDLQKWVEEFRGMMRTLISWQDGDFHFKNPTACTGRAGTCNFLPVCANGDFTALTRREVPYPELED